MPGIVSGVVKGEAVVSQPHARPLAGACTAVHGTRNVCAYLPCLNDDPSPSTPHHAYMRVLPHRLVLLVLDECHRAVGNAAPVAALHVSPEPLDTL